MTRVERCRTYCCFLVLLVVSSAVCICGQAQDLAVSPASISAQKLLRWRHMTPAQQADLRLRYRAWLAMAPDEHVRILKAKSGIASLSPMQQQALQARFARLDRMYSRGWLLGPRLGAHYAHLQPLIGYVQESERTHFWHCCTIWMMSNWRSWRRWFSVLRLRNVMHCVGNCWYRHRPSVMHGCGHGCDARGGK